MKLLYLHQSVRSLLIFIFFLTISKSSSHVQTSEYELQKLRDFDPDIEPYDNNKKIEKHILDYRKNGVRLDVKVVSAVNDSISEENEHFPMIPVKDLGHCVINLSLTCIKDRIARYIDTIGRLKQITLFGNTIKFVKIRSTPRINSRGLTTRSIDRSIDDFFDKFTLRITIPKWNNKKIQNQIDFMFDDSQSEGRGKGGGKGGKGCKQMMMCMMMGLKMKMIGMMGLMAMKGMMMAGVSMMMTKAMLVMKMMSSFKKGGGGGGGPWQGGGGGAPLKEIVLLTKATTGGGGGGGGGGGSYSPPPPPPLTSYGPPSTGGGGGGYDYSGGGGGGGGGGWGRSFDNRLSMANQANQYSNPTNSQQIVDNISIINAYPDTEDKFKSNSWESKNYVNSDEQFNQEVHTGEVYQMNEPKSIDLLPNIDTRISTDINNLKERSNERQNLNFDESKKVYADYWKNYEAADRIWNMKGPIVAERLLSK